MSKTEAAIRKAAPDMLAALEKIVASLTICGEPELAHMCYELETARQAIAKAKGEITVAWS